MNIFFIFFNTIIARKAENCAVKVHLILPLLMCILGNFLSGCSSYIYCSDMNTISPSIAHEKNCIHSRTAQHCLYRIIPPHRRCIRWYDIGHITTWMLFGNDDNGIFGEKQYDMYCPEQKPSISKAARWWIRNPFHNFCFYVIGSAERVNSEIDLLKVSQDNFSCMTYRPIGKTVFAGEGSSFYLALHGGKPFISLRFLYFNSWRTEIYLGWREKGNFGIKFLPLKKG